MLKYHAFVEIVFDLKKNTDKSDSDDIKTIFHCSLSKCNHNDLLIEEQILLFYP